jgi:hypothetical protein
MPGWARRHLGFVLALAIALAVVLRMAPGEDEGMVLASSDEYLPVAAAIGLSDTIPADATLATWVNSGLYTISLGVLSVFSPGTSAVDVGAAFILDPDGFCALAHFAGLAASVLCVYFVYLLVSRLLDPVAGVAAAYMLAVHPTAVAFTSGIGSGAFCLLFVLCGLLIATRSERRALRTRELAAIGIALGLALDSIPAAAVLLLLVIGAAVRETPREARGRLAGKLGLTVACFAAAAAAVMPGAAPLIETAWLIVVSTLIIGALVIARHALQSLREIVAAPTYSSIVLSLGLIVGVIAVMNARPTPPAESEGDARSQAAAWMVRSLPSDSVIVVHPDLADAIVLPRNAESWRREFRGSEGGSEAARLYALAAAKAALQLPGPHFDVIVRPPVVALRGRAAGADLPPEVHFLALPDELAPGELAPPGELWLVARFRSTEPGSPGVAIWGTQASPDAESIHVEWLISDAERMALRAGSLGAH